MSFMSIPTIFRGSTDDLLSQKDNGVQYSHHRFVVEELDNTIYSTPKLTH